ncbi:hypothetical protein [Nocardia coubleae]|uniref:Uncharacterized protein n=1 Tax=Nocardia coubleae TaxID=356147 RepID=A0A846WCD3_9NOCA|nr:hypothetical protein [Nocardia coubleae]NKX90961.1 hypothetical protein [Nocardia coubleae]
MFAVLGASVLRATGCYRVGQVQLSLGGELTEMLQADITALSTMSAALEAHATAIDGIGISLELIMPGSPIVQVEVAAKQAVLGAYRALSSNIRHMAEVTHVAANSYENVDGWFADQVRALESGQ